MQLYQIVFDALQVSRLSTKAYKVTKTLTKEVSGWMAGLVTVRMPLAAGSQLIEDWTDEIRGFAERVADSTVIDSAREKVLDTRNHVLNFFDVPSQFEIDQLQRKVHSIERRLNTLKTIKKHKK